MNITVSRVKKDLENDYGWDNLDCEDKKWFVDELINDVLSIVNDKMITYKNTPIIQRRTNIKTKKQ